MLGKRGILMRLGRRRMIAKLSQRCGQSASGDHEQDTSGQTSSGALVALTEGSTMRPLPRFDRMPGSARCGNMHLRYSVQKNGGAPNRVAGSTQPVTMRPQG
jgi:hypothetical protein